MPALDPHSIAWHRFIRRDSRMNTALVDVREPFISTRLKVQGAIAAQSWRLHEVEKRPYVHVDDFVAWNERELPSPYLETNRRLSGIHVASWNRWIEAHTDPDGELDFHGLVLSKVQNPFVLRDAESVEVQEVFDDAEAYLKHRHRSISALITASRRSPTNGFRLTERQEQILELLRDKGPLHTGRIAEKIDLKQSTVYKPGTLKELIERQLIERGSKYGLYVITKWGLSALAKKRDKS